MDLETLRACQSHAHESCWVVGSEAVRLWRVRNPDARQNDVDRGVRRPPAVTADERGDEGRRVTTARLVSHGPITRVRRDRAEPLATLTLHQISRFLAPVWQGDRANSGSTVTGARTGRTPRAHAAALDSRGRSRAGSSASVPESDDREILPAPIAKSLHERTQRAFPLIRAVP